MSATQSKFDPRKNPDWRPGNAVPDATKQKARRLYLTTTKTLAEIATACGVTPSTVEKWFRAMEIKRDRRWPMAKYEEAVRLRMSGGLHNREISERIGVPEGTIYHWMGRTPHRLGGVKKYPLEYPSRARYLRGCGYTVTEIAYEMDVPRSTAGGWVEGCPCDL